MSLAFSVADVPERPEGNRPKERERFLEVCEGAELTHANVEGFAFTEEGHACGELTDWSAMVTEIVSLRLMVKGTLSPPAKQGRVW